MATYDLSNMTSIKYNNTNLDKVIFNGVTVWQGLKGFKYSNLGGFGWAFGNSKSWTADEECFVIVSAGEYSSCDVNVSHNGVELCNFRYESSSRYAYTKIYKLAKGNTITVSGSGDTANGGQSSFIMTKMKPFNGSLKLVNQGGQTQGQTKTFTATRDCLLVVSRSGYDYSADQTCNGQQLYFAETTDANRWADVYIFYMKKGQTFSIKGTSTTGIQYPHRMTHLTELYI